MASPDISTVPIYISCGSLFVSACALTLQVRRSFSEGVRLTMNIIANSAVAGGLRPDNRSFVMARVVNRGNAATTITHMYIEGDRRQNGYADIETEVVPHVIDRTVGPTTYFVRGTASGWRPLERGFWLGFGQFSY